MKPRPKQNRTLESVVAGSENVFRDLGFGEAEAAELAVKSQLTRQIYQHLLAMGLTQTAAGQRMGISQPDVSKLMNGRHTGFSVDRLIALLNALAVDVEIIVRPRKPGAGARRGSTSVRRVA
jgi:predicted XRE-type DNA-binding protein